MRTMLRSLALLACAACAAPALAQLPPPVNLGPYTMPADTPDYIRRAIESPDRPQAQKDRDSARKPAEILMLAGIKPGDHVIEIAGFGQYFTQLLSEVVGPQGKVEVYDLPYTERFAGEASRAFAAAHPNVVYHQQDYNEVEFPQDVDAAFNVLYYHDLILQKIDTAKMNGKLLAALKPGRPYLIVDHKAEDGSGTRDVESIHRIDAQVIKDQLLASGFELALESDLLAHPEDDRSKMVFTPGLRGATDQALFVFRKPE